MPNYFHAHYADKSIVVNTCFLENFGANKLGCIAYKTGSNRYRKVEDRKENKSVKFPARNSHTPKSYDQKTEQIHEY